ncbi:interleukin-like EMT inducer domain-containing protein [soil metagenome]
MNSVSLTKASRKRRHLAVLFVYTVLALLLTWPLARHFTTHVPGDGIDDPSLAWNLWWIKARLIEQLNFDIFHVDWMFHPIDINLGFYTLTPLNGLLSTPLQLALSLIVANNLVLLSSFILGGYGTFLLVRDLLNEWAPTESPQAAPQKLWFAPLIAGLIYAFASSKLFYVSLGQFNIASSQWIPFCVLYLLRMGRSATWRAGLRNALLAGLFLTFQAWAELTYASFLLIFIGLYFIWLLLVPARRGQATTSDALSPTTPTKRLFTIYNLPIASFALLALTFLIGIAPFLWAMLPDLRREGNFFASGGGFADIFSADLLGYLLPTRLHPLFGQWAAALPFPNDKGQQIYIGYLALALVIVGAVALLRQPQTRQSGWFWLLITFFFWLLTLGPHVRWAGHDLPLPGPFALISKLPFFSGNRYPSRYSVMLMLGVAVLAGAGVRSAAWRLRQVKFRSAIQTLLMVGIVVLFLFEHASLPLPLNDSRVPAIYQTLAAQKGDFTVLELPTGWRNGARVLGKSDKLIMMQQWYQTVYNKRRLGGNTSRNPAYKFQYFTEAPLIGDLIALMNADSDHNYLTPVIKAQLEPMIAHDRPLAAQVLNFLDVRYVTLDLQRSSPALLRFVEEALPLTPVDQWQGFDWTGQPNTIRLYQVKLPPQKAAWEINLAEPFGKLYMAEGWSALASDQVRYAIRPQAALLLNIPETGGALSVELFSPATGAHVTVNGTALDAGALPDQAGWLTFKIPAGLANLPVDRLEFDFTGASIPITALRQPPDARGWPIGKTGAFLPATAALVARSAGNDVGDFAQIFVNGQDVALSGGEPAYNLVALDPQGKKIESVMFDTHTSDQAATNMAEWLARWPTGTVIAGAVADEASEKLGVAPVQALARLGVSGDLRGKQRWSHAFIGVVGAPAGSAIEQMSLLQPATVFVGAPVDAATVSGGIGRVRFTVAP